MKNISIALYGDQSHEWGNQDCSRTIQMHAKSKVKTLILTKISFW